MLTKSALEYVAGIYGILVGIFIPMIYLHGKLYFRNKRFSLRSLGSYIGRLAIIFILYGVVTAALLGTVGFLDSPEKMDELLESRWYVIGFFIGLLGGITLIKIGLRQAKKQFKPNKDVSL